jgi:hypothetical protein
LRIYTDVLNLIRIDPQHPRHPRSIRLIIYKSVLTSGSLPGNQLVT